MGRLVADSSDESASISSYDTAQLGAGVLGVLTDLASGGLLAMPYCASKKPADLYDSILQVRLGPATKPLHTYISGG